MSGLEFIILGCGGLALIVIGIGFHRFEAWVRTQLAIGRAERDTIRERLEALEEDSNV